MALDSALNASIIDVAARLGIPASWLKAIIQFESAGTFNPAITNSIGATGLIQFLPSTARSLGTTTDQLRLMSGPQQMEYVYRYFSPYRGRLATLADAYMAVLWPRAIGQPDSYVLWRSPSAEYSSNKGLDRNGDGTVTKMEAASLVTGLYVPDTPSVPISFTQPSPVEPEPEQVIPVIAGNGDEPEMVNTGLVAVIGVGILVLGYFFSKG